MPANHARSLRSSVDGPIPGHAALKVGDKLAGKYRVERVLGEGGMGVVVAAHNELLDQRVAVKLLYGDIADREAQTRLLQEARSAAKLQSDHVARVIDVDTGADGLPFIVMELLDGADLCAVTDARGALPRWLVVDYILQTLEGLAYAHARGIVHRDLKPSNLFLANRPDGSQIVKILDFGISKSIDHIDASGERRKAVQLTGGRTVLGSPPYMSPEQVRAPKTVDHRTDIWALGIVMYELLTNSMPFGGEELQETFAQILEKDPTPLRQLVNGVPEDLERVVFRCLAKSRDDRFADVSELAVALSPFGSGSWIGAADRVMATLARGVDDVSAPRGMVLPLHPDRQTRLSAPSGANVNRRPDSLQPELTGTARTMAARFTMFDGSRAWTFAGAVGAVVCVAMMVGGAMWVTGKLSLAPPVLGNGGSPPESAPAPAANAAPLAPAEPASFAQPSGATTSVSATPTGAGIPARAEGTVLGTSPPAAHPAQQSSRPAPAPASARMTTPASAPVTAPRKPASAAPSARPAPPAPAPAPSLHPGLPTSRDGL